MRWRCKRSKQTSRSGQGGVVLVLLGGPGVKTGQLLVTEGASAYVGAAEQHAVRAAVVLLVAGEGWGAAGGFCLKGRRRTSEGCSPSMHTHTPLDACADCHCIVTYHAINIHMTMACVNG
mmetsp:Transcript_33714/g.74639  ORF Transcript_33714/g.74639 Transcript_33714/m.74639 type:complete len:120 (-) Transcript_33714:1909-2268(-)